MVLMFNGTFGNNFNGQTFNPNRIVGVSLTFSWSLFAVFFCFFCRTFYDCSDLHFMHAKICLFNVCQFDVFLAFYVCLIPPPTYCFFDY